VSEPPPDSRLEKARGTANASAFALAQIAKKAEEAAAGIMVLERGQLQRKNFRRHVQSWEDLHAAMAGWLRTLAILEGELFGEGS
jgi:hypothetical protein